MSMLSGKGTRGDFTPNDIFKSEKASSRVSEIMREGEGAPSKILLIIHDFFAFASCETWQIYSTLDSPPGASPSEQYE